MDINKIRQCLTDLQWNLFYVHKIYLSNCLDNNQMFIDRVMHGIK